MSSNSLLTRDYVEVDINTTIAQDSAQRQVVDDNGDDEKNLVIFGKDLQITKDQMITITLLSLYFFLSSAYYSLFAPFFPAEALRKEISQTQVGFIFGVFQFVLLILTPFFGKYLQVFGIRFLFVGGLFISSGSEIVFGLLDMCPNGFTFFIMCMACRIVAGFGCSMGLSYAIVGHYFPNKISSLIAMLEMFNGLGLMIGPVMGGFLFEIGGFRLPFFVMGGLLFLIFIFAFFAFPNPKQTMNDNEQLTLPMLPLLKIPTFFFTLLMLFVGSLSIGFIEPSIQIHLIPLNLTPVQLGLILLSPSFLYILTTPIVGYFCDKYKNSMKWFMFISAIVSACSYSFFGPIPYLNLPLKLWIFLTGFIVYGFSIGGLVIPVYAELTRIAEKYGYPNDLRTQGLISGFFSSVWSLGALLGPVLGGYVVDQLGFNLASFGIVVSFLFSGLTFGFFNLINFFKRTNNRIRLDIQDYDHDNVENETSPLLNTE